MKNQGFRSAYIVIICLFVTFFSSVKSQSCKPSGEMRTAEVLEQYHDLW